MMKVPVKSKQNQGIPTIRSEFPASMTEKSITDCFDVAKIFAQCVLHFVCVFFIPLAH